MLVPYLFEVIDGVIQPARPSEIEPDGFNLLNAEDASSRFMVDVDRLIARWDEKWGHIYKRMQEGTINPRPSPATPDEIDPEVARELPPTPLTLTIETETYRTYITAEPLRNAEGGIAAGLCLWAEKLILLSGPNIGERREEVWFHEADHAYGFEKHAPKDEEGATDWHSKVARWSAAQYHAQGGLKTLLAMQPVAGVAPASTIYEPPIPEPKTKLSDEALFRIRWPFLPPKLVPLKMKELVAMKVHPFGKGYYIKGLKRDWGTEYEIVMKIGELRGRRDKAGGFAGLDPITYEYVEGNRFPVSCTYTGYKMIGGQRVCIPATVYWDEVYGEDIHKISEVVLAKPRRCLGVVAETYFLAQGWGEECADIVVREETIAPPVSQRAAAKTLPVASPVKATTPIPPNDQPQTELAMHTRLIELGYTAERSRNILIAKVMRQTGEPTQPQQIAFYARVIAEAKRSV